MANTLEVSNHTSIKELIKQHVNLKQASQKQIEDQSLTQYNLALKPLAKFEVNERNCEQHGILFCLQFKMAPTTMMAVKLGCRKNKLTST